MQAVVCGKAADVDLPRAIVASSYFRNLQQRAKAQELPRRTLRELERFVEQNETDAWEQSWVRLPPSALGRLATQILDHDLLKDKTAPERGRRDDWQRFIAAPTGADATAGNASIRVPVSYLLKLALADAISLPGVPTVAAVTGQRLLDHLINDNVSPETFTFYVAAAGGGRSLGQALAAETSLRFLLTQLLTQYANRRFKLLATGQRAVVYFSPHPPVRQQQLNELISDSFYRELFTSPCLSGWDRGEAKSDYMRLCHEVLSRSQLCAVRKVVREAGLVSSNLVVLPNLSNVSLANNGIHVSLGSRQISRQMADHHSGFGAREEKQYGDLTIKIIEHFLPLFVGTYSAAPYRFEFAEFHAERMLGFLPHQLDFTHLRMFWRRWKGKARVRLFGQPISPTGYAWLDRMLSLGLQLKGDFVADYRLLNYLVAPLSTELCAALDGTLDNHARLKEDLSVQGVYDPRLSLYMLYRQRAFHHQGFSGFEGRYYSLCPSLVDDLGPATDLQHLLTLVATRAVADGSLTHADIPDDPTTESERRQVFFGTAAEIPTFFVRRNTPNTLMRRILELTERTRPSRRYPGYVRVYNIEFRRALLRLLRRDFASSIEALEAEQLLADLAERIEPHGLSAAERLTKAILSELNVRSPWQATAHEFNLAAARCARRSRCGGPRCRRPTWGAMLPIASTQFADWAPGKKTWWPSRWTTNRCPP